MSDKLISILGDELLVTATSAFVTLDGSGNAILTVIFQVTTEATHDLPYSPSEDRNKRILHMVTSGKGVSTVTGVNVFSQDAAGTRTQFRIEAPIDTKVPNSGSDFAELERLFKNHLDWLAKSTGD